MTDEQLDEMARRWRAGEAIRDIGVAMGYSPGYVQQVAMRHRDIMPPRHHWTTRSVDQRTREQAIQMVAHGAGEREVAEEIGVCATTVRRWVEREEDRRWLLLSLG